MKQRVLGISLLHGRFTGAVVVRGKVEASWERPEPVTDMPGLGDALKSAKEKTGFSSGPVSVLIDGPRIERHFMSLPPMNQRDRALFLKRKAQTEKTFAADAAFSYYVVPSERGGDHVQLNLAEREFVDGLGRLCAGNDLELAQLAPFSAAVAGECRRLPHKTEEATAILIKAAQRLLLVIGTGEGEILFERTFAGDWSTEEGIARAGKEINRSLLYAKQRFGARIDCVWAVGALDDGLTQGLERHLDMPLRLGDRSRDTLFWIVEGTSLPPEQSGNFVTPPAKHRPGRGTMRNAAAGAAVAIWILSLAVAGYIEMLIGQGGRTESRLATLAGEKNEWTARHADMRRWKRMTVIATEPREPPIAGWLLGHFGDTLPEGLTITRLSVLRDVPGWIVRIEGKAREGYTASARSLEALEGALVSGPFRLQITQSWRVQWLEHLRKGVVGRHEAQTFTIEGRIQ